MGDVFTALNTPFQDALLGIGSVAMLVQNGIELAGLAGTWDLSIKSLLGPIPSGLAVVQGLELGSDAFISTLSGLSGVINFDTTQSVSNLLGLGYVGEATRAIDGFIGLLSTDEMFNFDYLASVNPAWEPAISVIAGHQDFEELPQETKQMVSEIATQAYEHGITVMMLILWAVNTLYVIQERGLDAASNFVSDLLMILLILKQWAEDER